MADDWIGINSGHLHSFCGEEAGWTLADALDGIDQWDHFTNEVHWFILDLGQTYTIKKLRARSNDVADPTDVDVYVSDDIGNWGAAVATGISTWQDTANWVEVDCADKNGRYIKVVINDTESPTNRIYFGNYTSPYPIFDAYGSVGIDVTIEAVTATADGEALAPSLMRDTIFTAVTATAEGEAPTPVLSLGITLEAPLVPITVEALAAALSMGITITPPAATIDAEALTPRSFGVIPAVRNLPAIRTQTAVRNLPPAR